MTCHEVHPLGAGSCYFPGAVRQLLDHYTIREEALLHSIRMNELAGSVWKQNFLCAVWEMLLHLMLNTFNEIRRDRIQVEM